MSISDIIFTILYQEYNQQGLLLDLHTTVLQDMQNRSSLQPRKRNHTDRESKCQTVVKDTTARLDTQYKLRDLLHYSNLKKQRNKITNIINKKKKVYSDHLQALQNIASRKLKLTKNCKQCHITPILKVLHWLPVKFCINFKILVLSFQAYY